MGSFQNRQPQRPIATEDGPPVSYVNELQGAPCLAPAGAGSNVLLVQLSAGTVEALMLVAFCVRHASVTETWQGRHSSR
jgi:hypothetical protein